MDNDPTIRALVADFSGQNDLRVTAVTNGRSLSKVLEREVVDLVLVEPRLRAEDGMTLARQLRDESAIPIIMLTGPMGRNRSGDRPRARADD